MVQSCIISRAIVCHRFSSNSGIDLIRRSSVILVERDEDDIKVGCDAGRGKEAAEPISGKCNAGIMAVVVNVGLFGGKVSEGVSYQSQCLPCTRQMLGVSVEICRY